MLVAGYIALLFMLRILILRWFLTARAVGLIFIMSGVSPISVKV